MEITVVDKQYHKTKGNYKSRVYDSSTKAHELYFPRCYSAIDRNGWNKLKMTQNIHLHSR